MGNPNRQFAILRHGVREQFEGSVCVRRLVSSGVWVFIFPSPNWGCDVRVDEGETWTADCAAEAFVTTAGCDNERNSELVFWQGLKLWFSSVRLHAHSKLCISCYGIVHVEMSRRRLVLAEFVLKVQKLPVIFSYHCLTVCHLIVACDCQSIFYYQDSKSCWIQQWEQ